MRKEKAKPKKNILGKEIIKIGGWVEGKQKQKQVLVLM
jgi:hypothetical protein